MNYDGLHEYKGTEAATLRQLVRKIQRKGDTKTGRFLSSRAAWSTEQVPGQAGLHRETLS